MAIYRIENDFLLCYDSELRLILFRSLRSLTRYQEFAFYVNKSGWRARHHFMIYWEGEPQSFGMLLEVRN